MVKRINLFSILICIVFFASNLYAATIYVDPTLSSSITNGTYNKNARSSGGSDGNAYRTLREVIWGTNGSNGAASAGDIILLRGGTYREAWGSSGSAGAAMQIPQRLNGTSWTAGNFTTIASYPGEWAILDGSTDGYYFGVGYGNLAWSNGAGALHYIKFERLGITGGSSAGLAAVLGPIWVTYCHIYENGKGSYGDDNRAGLMLRRGMGCIVEYNYFYNNSGTSSNNRAHIDNYADYLYTSGTYDINACNRDNTIRYNLFAGSTSIAYHDKAAQYLGNYVDNPSQTGRGYITDLTNKGHGNNIHHNISTGIAVFANIKQWFSQVHHNISDGGAITTADGSTERPRFGACMYNNTVVGNYISTTIGYQRLEPVLDLRWFCANNVVSQFGSHDYSPSIGIAVNWMRDCSSNQEYTWTNTIVDRNVIYLPTSTTRHIGLPNSYLCKTDKWVTTSSFNASRGTNNYYSTASGLFLGSSGANKYKINSSFSLGSSRTAGNGGLGGSHPYLSGVTIPSYVGAVDPNDSGWVDTVLGLSNINNLINGGFVSTPPEIPPTIVDSTPPVSPSGVSVMVIQ